GAADRVAGRGRGEHGGLPDDPGDSGDHGRARPRARGEGGQPHTGQDHRRAVGARSHRRRQGRHPRYDERDHGRPAFQGDEDQPAAEAQAPQRPGQAVQHARTRGERRGHHHDRSDQPLHPPPGRQVAQPGGSSPHGAAPLTLAAQVGDELEHQEPVGDEPPEHDHSNDGQRDYRLHARFPPIQNLADDLFDQVAPVPVSSVHGRTVRTDQATPPPPEDGDPGGDQVETTLPTLSVFAVFGDSRTSTRQVFVNPYATATTADDPAPAPTAPPGTVSLAEPAFNATLTISDPSPWQSFLLILPELLLTLVLCAVAVFLLLLMRSFRAGDPFTPDNARRLAVIGVLLLCVAA